MLQSGSGMKDKTLHWYAMSATYRSEFKSQELLAGFGLRSYVATRTVATRKGSHIREICRPLVSNLIFVHTTEQELREVKPKIPHLQYRVRTVGGKAIKIVVGDDDMETFIKFTASEGGCECLNPDNVNLKAGTPVKIIGGPLAGLKAVFVKAGRGRKSNVFVTIEGCISVGVTVERRYIAPLECEMDGL